MTDAPLLPDDEMLAAEYVLGVGDAASRAAAENRMRHDGAFAAMVCDWEERLSGLNADFAEAPAPHVLPRIETRLFGKPDQGPRLWTRWLLAGAVAAALLLAVLPQVWPPAPGMEAVAELTAEGSPLRFEVAWYADGTMKATRMQGAPAPAGQAHELWLIGADGVPHSLGLIGDGPMEKPMPEGMPMGVTLAITMEPAGGAPGGIPSGDVIASGVLTDA